MKGKFLGKSWLNSFLNRWLMYLYPFLIIGIEVALRAADKAGVMTLEITSFIGPSLAAAGAAFVVPLTAKKPMTQEKLEKLKKDIIQPAIPAQSTVTVDETAIVDAILKLSQKRYSITSPEEDDMRNICLGFAIILTALWVWALWLSLHPSNRSLWFIPIGLIPGLINCLFGLVLTEAREGVK